MLTTYILLVVFYFYLADTVTFALLLGRPFLVYFHLPLDAPWFTSPEESAAVTEA